MWGKSLWADNETDVDLLGFDVLVDELVVALTDPRLLPLTVGVLGDWGSGKSSLLKIARHELEADEQNRYVCAGFSPWQYEDYDDVKAALMGAVLDACQSRAASQEAELQVGRLRRFVNGLARRSRAVGRAALAAVPAAAPALIAAADPALAATTVAAGAAVASAAAPLAAGALDEHADPAAPGDDIHDIAEFRDTFSRLVRSLDGVDAVVVFIDDLDRCLPETVVDTFEAIRLFLNAPRTAYVVAANREIVESAIDSRYPELRRHDGRGIGHDYLEKMLQLQVSVPPLSAAETEAYVNLLVTELHLSDTDFGNVCAALRERRTADPFGSTYNKALAGDVLGDLLTPALSDDLTWASDISPALSDGLRGNPRQVKRFLNDLTWRKRAAARRSVELRPDVLAKLMVLEERDGDDFQTLFDWQLGSDGPSRQVVLAEALARADDSPQSAGPPASSGGSPKAKTPGAAGTRPGSAGNARQAAGRAGANPDPPEASAAREQAAGWVARPRIRAWLRLPPDLTPFDLRPYFTYFRDRLIVGSAASALRPALRAILGRITSDVPAISREALAECAALPAADQDELAAAVLDAAVRRPDGAALPAAAEFAARVPRTAPGICDALSRIPHPSLPAMKIPGVLRRLPDGPEKDALAAGWAASSIPAVAAAASAAARPRPGS